MSFCEDIEDRTLEMRQGILSHPFVTGVGDGTLSLDRFKHYVTQDYAYLIEYSRVLALASARATDLETMGWFAKLLDETLNVEMDLHRSYCAEFGITEAELEATEAAPTTIGYTSYLLQVAHQGSFGELVAALLPCQWDTGRSERTWRKRGNPPTLPYTARGSGCTPRRTSRTWPARCGTCATGSPRAPGRRSGRGWPKLTSPA